MRQTGVLTVSLSSVQSKALYYIRVESANSAFGVGAYQLKFVFDPTAPSAGPSYFILLGWSGEAVLTIRDFRHARYAIEAAEVSVA